VAGLCRQRALPASDQARNHDGFHNRDLCELVADLLGVTGEQCSASQMACDMRRLRLKGLIF
jgi:hypothetical protein